MSRGIDGESPKFRIRSKICISVLLDMLNQGVSMAKDQKSVSNRELVYLYPLTFLSSPYIGELNNVKGYRWQKSKIRG